MGAVYRFLLCSACCSCCWADAEKDMKLLGRKKGEKSMNTMTNQMLKAATSGLTGRREHDIAYLREQIREYHAEETLVMILENILGCLAMPE